MTQRYDEGRELGKDGVGKYVGRCLPVLLAGLLSACGSQEWYEVGQQAKQAQCTPIPDQREYEQCMRSAGKSYEQYEKERQAVLRRQ